MPVHVSSTSAHRQEASGIITPIGVMIPEAVIIAPIGVMIPEAA